jgi:hypothetical protein
MKTNGFNFHNNVEILNTLITMYSICRNLSKAQSFLITSRKQAQSSHQENKHKENHTQEHSG